MRYIYSEREKQQFRDDFARAVKSNQENQPSILALVGLTLFALFVFVMCLVVLG